MFGWSIRASACRSASNRAITSRVSMPGLMTFSATLRRTGCCLFGDKHEAKTTLADLLHKLVAANPRARAFGNCGLHLGRRFDRRGRHYRRAIQHIALGVVRRQQRLDALPQLGVIAASADPDRPRARQATIFRPRRRRLFLRSSARLRRLAAPIHTMRNRAADGLKKLSKTVERPANAGVGTRIGQSSLVVR